MQRVGEIGGQPLDGSHMLAKVIESAGRNGPEIEYDVRLDNSKRGILPARMLREPAGP